jgi:hypothetical protein
MATLPQMGDDFARGRPAAGLEAGVPATAAVTLLQSRNDEGSIAWWYLLIAAPYS